MAKCATRCGTRSSAVGCSAATTSPTRRPTIEPRRTTLAKTPYNLRKFASATEPETPQNSGVESNQLFNRNYKRSGSGKNFDGQRNIAIKLNLTPILFKGISLQGEYAFHPKMSFALGFTNFLTTNLPNALNSSTDPHFSPIKFSGYNITPEFRFYPSGDEEKGAPKGRLFYFEREIVLTEKAIFVEIGKPA